MAEHRKLKTLSVIDDRTYNSEQSWYHTVIKTVKIDGARQAFKIQMNIRRNAYDFQSYAQVRVWNPTTMTWEHVAEIPHTDMASCRKGGRSGELSEISYTDKQLSPRGMGLIEEDIWELERLAEKILG